MTTQPEQKERRVRKVMRGMVMSSKMDKTVVVRVTRQVKHPRYKKYVRRYARFMAHDEENQSKIGDRVRIVEHRPLSKRKRWKLQETLASANPI